MATHTKVVIYNHLTHRHEPLATGDTLDSSILPPSGGGVTPNYLAFTTTSQFSAGPVVPAGQTVVVKNDGSWISGSAGSNTFGSGNIHLIDAVPRAGFLTITFSGMITAGDVDRYDGGALHVTATNVGTWRFREFDIGPAAVLTGGGLGSGGGALGGSDPTAYLAVEFSASMFVGVGSPIDLTFTNNSNQDFEFIDYNLSVVQL